MSDIEDRLNQLRVSDLMARRVTSVAIESTAAQAAQAMHAAHVTAAPVVDGNGVCVGIVTATDFLRWAAEQPQADLGKVPLRDVMRWAVQTIDADASVLLAARMMCAAHVHRLLVVDRDGRPAGILSSLDLVAMMTKIVDELAPRRSVGQAGPHHGKFD
ncbi:MAG: hypothetical protein KatS3mg110_2738 [Pirellulaceae bacterium]|nr:MAG: hypothetical protein KatS3mg110_2738 [Pirellulaceae bacterium]